MSSPVAPFLCPPGYAGPKGLRALSRESSSVLEAASLARRSARDRLARRGRPYTSRAPVRAGDPVVLVPGFLAGDYTLYLMARFLRRQGFRTYRSTIRAANVGCTRSSAEELERRVESIAIRRDSRVSLVGHSLGGLLARGLAARRPDLVEGIITMGSPMLAPGAMHQVLALDLRLLTALSRAGLRGLMSDDCVAGECAQQSWQDSRKPLAASTAFTAIYSQRDGIVDWRACIDPAAVPVEVSTSHLGMALDPAVFDCVARALLDQQVSRASRAAAPRASAG